MKNNRYLLCLLACGVMLYYGVPKLSSFNGEIAGWFSVLWLMLALFVIAGNVSGILYAPRQQVTRQRKESQVVKKKRVRSH